MRFYFGMGKCTRSAGARLPATKKCERVDANPFNFSISTTRLRSRSSSATLGSSLSHQKQPFPKSQPGNGCYNFPSRQARNNNHWSLETGELVKLRYDTKIHTLPFFSYCL